MKFDEAHTGRRQARTLGQTEAARLLVMCTAEPATAFIPVSFPAQAPAEPRPDQTLPLHRGSGAGTS